ncbi:MAG: DUF1492 domain-containing protein [Chloroflexi bacterium]|nr:DUF1492 domain-containing protein [Chloroflexota bacterium]
MLDDVYVDSPHFVTHVSNALEHYWEVGKLSKHPLSNLNCLTQFLREDRPRVSSLERGRAVQQLLDHAMDQVRTLDCGNHTAEARYHAVLEKEYVERVKNQYAAQQLDMSESTFYRVRREAVACLAQVIADMERGA